MVSSFRKLKLFKVVGFNIKPASTHLPVCVLHLVPRSGHPKSLQPRHFPIAIIHIGWGSSQSLLLVQPIIGIFKGSEHEKIFHPFLWIFGIEFYKNLQRTFTIVFQFSVYYRITLFILIPYLDFLSNLHQKNFWCVDHIWIHDMMTWSFTDHWLCGIFIFHII